MKRTLTKLLELKRGTIGPARTKKCISNHTTLERLAGGAMDEVLPNLEKTHQLGEKISASPYSPATKSDLRLLLKMLWKVANGHDLEDRPKEIRWIKVGVARRDRKHPPKISEDDFQRMLSVSGGRDKAILSVLYEAGLRPHELLGMKKSDVEFVKEGARLDIPEGSKTGTRNVLVIDSEPLLAGWLSSHPLKGDAAPLFPALNGQGFGKRMSVEGLSKLVKAAAKKAGITRRIKTYDLRHTAATRLARILTDAQMKAYFGWTQDSSMAATYVNLSGRDVDAPLLAAHGKKADKHELEGKLSPQICSRCGKQNAHDAALCQYCGLPFDKTKMIRDDMKLQAEIESLKKFREEVYRSRLLAARPRG